MRFILRFYSISRSYLQATKNNTANKNSTKTIIRKYCVLRKIKELILRFQVAVKWFLCSESLPRQSIKRQPLSLLERTFYRYTPLAVPAIQLHTIRICIAKWYFDFNNYQTDLNISLKTLFCNADQNKKRVGLHGRSA